MKNLFIIGDSLACPRPWEGIGCNQVYSTLIQKEVSNDDVYVVNLAGGGRSSSDYLTDTFFKTYVVSGAVSYLVIQVGIVDCAPRLLTTFERILAFLCGKTAVSNKIFSYYIRWKSKHRMFFTKWFPMTKIKVDNYEKNIRKIISNFSQENPLEKIVLVNIAYPGHELVDKSWGILENIHRYNKVLEAVKHEAPDKVAIIDLFEKTKANKHWITKDDGHHVLAEAHEWIALQIVNIIRNNF